MTENRTTGAAGQGASSSTQGDESAPARPLASSELLRGAKCVEISHNGAVYRLQATRLGKLILTK